MRLSLVVSTQPAHFEAVAFKGDFARRFEQVARLGYDGVELAVRDPALIDVNALEAAVARCGLAVPAIGTGQAWGEERLSLTDSSPDVRAAALGRLKSHLRLAARFQAVTIVGLIRGVTPLGIGRPQALTWLADAVRDCAEAASRLGLQLVIEPINRYETDLVNTVDEGLALVDRIGADNVGLLLDTFHMNIEEPSIEASLRRAGPRITHLHAADSNRRYPGAGHLDFQRILSTLRVELNYQGWISAEILPEPEAETAAERALGHLRAWVAQA
jgi:sugar phosphate isomerase/epimerase